MPRAHGSENRPDLSCLRTFGCSLRTLALRSQSYYRDRWNETHALREELSAGLRALGWDVVPGCANFVLCHLPHTQPEAPVVVAECRRRNLFVRDVANMGACFDARTLRVAVKDARTNAMMLEILRTTLASLSEERVKAA